ncbi:CPBP family intramembrane glutamic endopeptidase [uncultured Microbacterium sp.]|uniref:CPBP family intramembrane glutamic endopeptidase n=1 Tax=uncultured Microbacterium sp. TaxID=191216 RepID=UPI0025EE3036|nr:CPBP family intramembrane glutamic endopeptidase [uncultured Microbacterium sp.]
MPGRVRWGAVILYTVLACALAWLVCLPLWIGDGLVAPLAAVLLPAMMLTPMLAALVVTFALRTPAPGMRLRGLGLWPLRPAKRVVGMIVLGWLAPPVIVVLTVVVAVALGFVHPDWAFTAFAAELAAKVPPGTALPPTSVIVLAQVATIPLAAILNAVFAFGEELGWRGWLLPALRPLGTWPALLLSGAIWGFWHTPVILLGYNFGRMDATGVLLMIVGCVGWGVLFGWLRLRSGSVWPAVLAHGALNAAAGLVVLLGATQTDLALAGPLGVSGWIVCGLVIVVLALTRQFRAQPPLAPPRPRPVATPAPPASSASSSA